MFGELVLVVREEFPDNAFVLFPAGFDEVLQSGGQFLQRHVHVVGVGQPEVAEDFPEIGLLQTVFRRQITVEGIYAADQQERVRVSLVPAAHFLYGLVLHAQGQTKTACYLQSLCTGGYQITYLVFLFVHLARISLQNYKKYLIYTNNLA